MKTRAFTKSVQIHIDDDGREYTIEVRYYPPGKWRKDSLRPGWAWTEYGNGSAMASRVTAPPMPFATGAGRLHLRPRA
jgi:hypothetical protein